MYKQCIKCKTYKILDEFYNNKKSKDGKTVLCKICQKEQNKKYNKENKEKIKEQKKQYRKDNKNKINKQRKKYKEENKEKLKEQYEKDKEEINLHRRNWYQQNKERVKSDVMKRYYKHHEKEKEKSRNKHYKKGGLPMADNRECGAYLGVVIGERLLKHLFNDVIVMPLCNEGYDLICNKGKKIDVKTSTIHLTKYPHWSFSIKKNKIADYFICVAFDNRKDLNVIHLWMIPSHVINNKITISIMPTTLHKWCEYEIKPDDARICCETIKKTG